MKRKMIITFVMLVLGVSFLIGCGKSDEEKARDEIMSHMDADEKANIATDQKEMAEWEAEQQARRESAEAEQAAIPDYSDELLTTYDIDWQTPLKVMFISEDYLDDTCNPSENYFSSEIGGVSLISQLGNAWYNGIAGNAKSYAEQDAQDAFYGRYGNYTLAGFDRNGVENYILVTDLVNNSSILFNISTSNNDVRKDVYDKNIEFLKEQLEGNADTEYEEAVAYEEVDHESFGCYYGEETNAIIGTGDSAPMEITMQGAQSFKGELKWRISDDAYECRTDETWLQVQFVDSNTIIIKSSNSSLEGTYTREY